MARVAVRAVAVRAVTKGVEEKVVVMVVEVREAVRWRRQGSAAPDDQAGTTLPKSGRYYVPAAGTIRRWPCTIRYHVLGSAPDDLALLDDAAQLSQHGLPHVNCAHASRLRLGSRGKHA